MAQNNEQLDASYRQLLSRMEAHRNRLAEAMAGLDTLEVMPKYIAGVLSGQLLGAVLQTRPESSQWDSTAELWSRCSHHNEQMLDILVLISQVYNVDISFIHHLPQFRSAEWRALFILVRLLSYNVRDSICPLPQPDTIGNGDMQDANTDAEALIPYNPETDCPVCLMSYPRFVEFPCFQTHKICERCLFHMVSRGRVACPLCRAAPFADM
ncbi:uncharacterized protein MELLADRAFT_110164 [Melampsora larici-populina 98AG31]|uniref:RING-type domain-containing protein n=1 Tax=Melampsora larici-populina (strain 98AG31 / pathotype 3-4-7) TaxID=747676 RepID=F4RYW3_MELLP|nr:uncharacterized protein MELLADRAFT_110164 [Melampsora larici-populina 98AG31]EGG02319.1 hypothetical protein MELLADRAFT_110164 [Melampsora larici-populina 98AG31]